MVKRFFPILLILTIVLVLIVYHQPISQFSDQFLLLKGGRAAWQAGNLKKAADIYQKGLEKYPDHPDIKSALAKIYSLQNETTASEALFKEALEKNPKDTELRIAYAQLLSKDLSKLNKAKNHILSALQHDPNNSELLQNLGDIYKKAGENPREKRKAVRHWLFDWSTYYYRRAIQQDTRHYQSRFNLGVLYQLTKRPYKASIEYCNAILLNPNSFEAHYNLGLVLIEQHIFNPGYKELSKAVNLLSQENRIEEARLLAKQIQTVKNMYYYQAKKTAFTEKEAPSSLTTCLGQS